MDKFKQIEAFVLVAQKGSLSAVAQTLDVTPAMVGGALTRWRSAWA